METQIVNPTSYLSLRVLIAVLANCFVLCLMTSISFSTRTIATTTNVRNETDFLSLLAFKSMIKHDPPSMMSSWNDSHHFCEWEGVMCSPKHRRVTVLDLSSKGLVGSLSPCIGNMSFLREIRLGNNSLQGKIPPEAGRLFRLQVLNLSNNALEGEIPANLSHCSHLEVLSLDDNKLVGMIPVELASLSKLKQLSIRDNFLIGGIPSFVRNLTSLENLFARNNLLGGSIPDALGELENLLMLGIGGNNLSGTIPPSICNISSMTAFSVSENNLYGSIPADFGFTLPSLVWLQIRDNYFSGSIPKSLSNASRLQTIELASNNFTGKVAVDFGNMQELINLQLSGNNLGSGEADEFNFLFSLQNCSNLKVLSFYENQLKGVLPNSITNLTTQLKAIYISNNQLSGDFPYGLGNLVNLDSLSIGNNFFSGTIPSDFGQLKKLERLYLAYNNFFGEIPSFWGNLTMLSRLFLDHNQLRGTIPSSLGNCQNLLLLDLSHNNLSGTIPNELFAIRYISVSLNLAQNQLVGPLPSEIGNLFNLNELDVSQNKLSGKIPYDLGRCSSLERLYMENNNFQDAIPPSLASLKGLQNFDLSRNNLSGRIPEYLEKLDLVYLNLSFNDLEGEVPMNGIFVNGSAVSVEGNKRLCGGISDLKLTRCTIRTKRCKTCHKKLILISVACAFFGVTMVSSVLFCWFERKKKKNSLVSLLEEPLWNASYESLLKATDGFSSTNLVGVGSFGSVYKGILDDNGAIIAVKVLNLQRRGASKSFMAECKALRNIRHRNLLKVLTCCSSIDFQGNDFKALVYEFMPNGSLEKWLHPVSEMNSQLVQYQNLSLLQRLNIAIDIANALDYLHHHCGNPILHCDLKPSNVLLDSDMVAHVGDFGLSKFLTQLANPTQSSSIGVRGTIGYTAPEYGLGSKVSTNGDVYSYGILLLEMITGKRPTDIIFQEELNIHKFARIVVPDQVATIIDPPLLNADGRTVNNNQGPLQATQGHTMECMVSIVKIGVACSMESPEDRMDICDVVKELQAIKNKFPGAGANPSVH